MFKTITFKSIDDMKSYFDTDDDDNKSNVFDEIISAIKENITNDIDVIHYAIIDNGSEDTYDVKLFKSDWVDMVDNAIIHFERIEDYEKCIELKEFRSEVC